MRRVIKPEPWSPRADTVDFLIRQFKDEIAFQSATFDQIDSKTGVILGFTFIVVGQVLAAVFRMATDQNHFHSSHPKVAGGLFLIANVLALFGLCFGAASRWPRAFDYSVDLTKDEAEKPYDELGPIFLEQLKESSQTNAITLEKKGKYASGTYIFVGLALIAYLALSLLLFFTSVPIS